MAYSDKFNDVDVLITGLSPIIPQLSSDLQSKIVGFLAVNAVTAFELAVKEILIDYANSRHSDFGYFITEYLHRLNGKIAIPDLKNEIKKYGTQYPIAFETELQAKEREVRKNNNDEMRPCYQNLLTCRHSFVHSSRITLTISECIYNYKIGKNVIEALYNTMK